MDTRAIDSNKNFFLTKVPNRSINTLTEYLLGKIRIGSLLCTDGYPSYPGVADNLALNHRVVNHSMGFVGSDGTHTNNIEAFWSHMKSSMRKENGVMRVNIDNWLNEYTFKRRYIVGANKEEFEVIFKKILKYLFSE